MNTGMNLEKRPKKRRKCESWTIEEFSGENWIKVGKNQRGNGKGKTKEWKMRKEPNRNKGIYQLKSWWWNGQPKGEKRSMKGE